MIAVASISSLRTHAQVIANGGHWVSIRAVCVKDLFPWLTAKLRGCAHYCMPASISCHIVLSSKNGSAAVVGLAVSLLSPHWYPESFQSNKTHQPHKSKHIPKNSSPLQVWLTKCSTCIQKSWSQPFQSLLYSPKHSLKGVFIWKTLTLTLQRTCALWHQRKWASCNLVQ